MNYSRYKKAIKYHPKREGFKPEKIVFISITLNADSVASKISFEPSFVC